MNKRPMTTLFVAGLLTFLVQSTWAQEEVKIKGKVLTGFNQYLGQPVMDIPALGPMFGFQVVGEYVPDAPPNPPPFSVPLPLTPATPDDAILATILDPALLVARGIFDPITMTFLTPVNMDLVNVPLRQVPVFVPTLNTVAPPPAPPFFFDFQTRTALPASTTVGPWDYSQAGPATPVDLGTWKQARGIVSFMCNDDGTSEFLLAARNLLPHRLYSISGAYLNPEDSCPPEFQPFCRLRNPRPMGGVPSGFVTDEKGRGSIRRTLNSCPLTQHERPDEPQLILLDFLLHSDSSSYGVGPAIPNWADANGEVGLATGTVTQTLMTFNFNSILNPESDLLEPEGWGGNCTPGFTTFCLNDGRFQVEMDWIGFDNNSGKAKTLDFSSDESGTFYFFNRDNWETVVKVLDACHINDHYWVFAASATNVEYTITVTDTQTNQTRTYENQLGIMAPAVTDTTAFATCP